MIRPVVIVVALVALTLQSVAQERDRAKINDKYKWNLADIYPTTAAWRTAKDQLQAELPRLQPFKGKLQSSPATLADALDTLYSLDKELSRLYVYAGMLADQDTRNSEHQGMRQEMTQLVAAFGAEASYIEPEVVRFPAGTVERYLQAEPRLTIYRFYLEDIARRAPHTLTDAEEKLLADVGPLAGSPSETFGILANADFPYPTVTLSDGKAVKLDQAAFAPLRALPNRADREKVMSSFFGALGGFSRTYGTTMNSQAQRSLFFSKARKYPSTLEAALDGPNIPVSVYMRLIDGVGKQLPTFHRYLKLRKRMMGVDQLHYYDLYAPLVGSVKLDYSPEEAQKHVLAAVEPLGTDYQSVIQRAFKERWIDLFPNEGKRSGAYSNGGAYDVHPYMLLNYNGRYDDVSTLAHELGHTMQSYYSNKTQPYPLANYPIFVAEVASTFNEALLIDYMLKTIRIPRRGCRCSGTISKASRAPCSARRSSPNSSCACTRWRKRGNRLPATRWRNCIWTSRRSTTGTRPAYALSTTTLRTSGATSLISTATSTSSSTPRRLRPRRRWLRKSRPAIPRRAGSTWRFCPRVDRSIRSSSSRTPAST